MVAVTAGRHKAGAGKRAGCKEQGNQEANERAQCAEKSRQKSAPEHERADAMKVGTQWVSSSRLLSGSHKLGAAERWRDGSPGARRSISSRCARDGQACMLSSWA